MIEFSQAEIREILAIVLSEISHLTNINLPVSPELQSILAKLKAAYGTSDLRAELLRELEIAAEQGDQMAKLQLEFGPEWNSRPT